MDRRSWPWRKKSSEKTLPTYSKPSPAEGSSNGTAGNHDTQDNSKNVVSYVQLSQERYAHLSEMEDQVKLLNEQLSTAQSELTTKEALIKQHTKVAEEAVSGWEKAEAEALALKNQLESVTLQKLTAEDRVAHLDGALKECMKQIRNVKEESEQKLHDVIFAKTKQWEKIKFEFEAKINVFEQELLKSAADTSALSRSLQERSDMLMKINEEKSQAEAEIEVLKTNIHSCERELSSMQYEVHIVSKELEIRNEEKNMSVRAAEVANKQHLEDVKKITKLESECQRLRGLVRKKLPGPAALAQMKVEVESLGRDYGDSRLRRSPVKSSSLHLVSSPDYALENIQQCQKENEFLTERLLATEEETKMLKEVLSKRNSELQVSRNMFAKTASKLRSLEAQMLVLNQQRSPSKSNAGILMEGPLLQNESNPPSLASMSEDGIDDAASCSGSWATALISELSHFKKEKDVEKSSKAGSSSHLELMDDFLEMERIACLSTESNGPPVSDGVKNKLKSEKADSTPLIDEPKDVSSQKEGEPDMQSVGWYQNEIPFSKLQSKLALIFEGQSKDGNMVKLLEDIKNIVHETEEELPQHPVTCIVEEIQPIHALDIRSNCHDNVKPTLAEDLKNTISKIHDSVLSLASFSDSNGLGQTVEEFSSIVNRVLSGELSVDEFITSLSMVLSESCQLGSKIFGAKDNREAYSPDCIDKVTLLENKVVQHEAGKNRLSNSSSDAEILRSGPDYEIKNTFSSCSLEDFEHLKVEKENLVVDLAKSNESLEQTKSQLHETEQLLEDLKSQLAICQKSNGLAETQLKCMAESYRSLELRTVELENEINMLQSKLATLDSELQEERCAHQECLAECKDLQEQVERNGKCSMGSLPSEVNAEITTKQDMEIAAAAEKLAECQETIFLLGRQLKSMQPQPDFLASSPNERIRLGDDFSEDLRSTSGSNQQGWPIAQLPDHAEMENASSTYRRTGGESPFEGYSFYSPSDIGTGLVPRSPINPKNSKHKSSRSSSSPNPTEEKHGRGFSRFFSKGKNNQ